MRLIVALYYINFRIPTYPSKHQTTANRRHDWFRTKHLLAGFISPKQNAIIQGVS